MQPTGPASALHICVFNWHFFSFFKREHTSLMAEILSTALVKKGECFRFIAADFETWWPTASFHHPCWAGPPHGEGRKSGYESCLSRFGLRPPLANVWSQAKEMDKWDWPNKVKWANTFLSKHIWQNRLLVYACHFSDSVAHTLSLLLHHIAILIMLMRRLGSQNTFCSLLLMNPIVSFVAVTVWFGKKKTKKTTTKHRCDKVAAPNIRGEEKQHICCGSQCCQADRPYGLFPLSTSHISAPLIWQEWHLRRGCELCFNEHCTLLNSLCVVSPCRRSLHCSPRALCMHMSEHAHTRESLTLR